MRFGRFGGYLYRLTRAHGAWPDDPRFGHTSIDKNTSAEPKVLQGQTDGESMARFASFIAAALVITALGNAAADKATATMNAYKASVDDRIATIR